MLSLFKKKPPAPRQERRTILVPDTVLQPGAEPYALMGALVDYVNHMQGTALYRRDEIPQEAVWLYHADYYLAQVNNGGHSQFMHNVALTPGADWTYQDTANALELIGANERAEIFAQMQSWRAQNPTKAAVQNGFSERDPDLDALDKRFFALPKDSFYAACNAWLQNSGLLAALPQSDLAQALELEANANPDRAKRQRIQLINQLQASITSDPLSLFKIAAAGLSGKSGPVEVNHLTAGSPKPDGTVIWGVASNHGVLAGYVTDEKVIVAETGRENGFSAGKTLGECALAPAQEQVKFARGTMAAAFSVELLARVNKTAKLRCLSPVFHELQRDKKGQPHLIYRATTTANQDYQLTVTEDAAAFGPFPMHEPMEAMYGRAMTRLRTEVEAHNTYEPTR